LEKKLGSEYILSVKDIIKNYKIGNDELKVLKGITFGVKKGEIVSIIGPSGVGKSTLLNILGTLDKPTQGKVYIASEDVTELSEDKLASFRNKKIGFVFQFHHLLPEFTALENTMMPAIIGKENRDDVREKAEKLLSEVGLRERVHHKPGELSGGELQRVAFARALINNPSIVLADEPTGNLDRINSEALHEIIWSLCKEKKQTFFLVTHNEQLAEKADKIIELFDGKIKREIRK
jgi:lipoprotein-releasing system ATP-binding protein